MEFSEFFKLMKPVLGRSRANASLVRNLVSMITKLDCRTDPSRDQSDATLKDYASGKRKISEEYARGIIAELDIDNFIDSVLNYDIAVLKKLSDSFATYNPQATPDDIASITAEIFLDILYRAAGKQTDLKKSSAPNQLLLKHRYGSRLLIENRGSCPYEGCRNVLVVRDLDLGIANFEVVKIDTSQEDSIDNLIALCPECAHIHTLKNDPDDIAILSDIKLAQQDSLKARKTLSDVKIEQAISEILEIISTKDPLDFAKLSYEPKSVRDKIYKNNHLLLLKILSNVTQHYPYIEEQFKSFSREKRINYERLSMQIRSAFLTAAESTNIQYEIFTSLVEWLMNITNKTREACEIVISFFVQKCEVFDAITK